MLVAKVQPLLLSVFFSSLAVSNAEEGCYQYRRKDNVTIDTDQCLWKNYTEPKTKRYCLESCFKNNTVRTLGSLEQKEILSQILLLECASKGDWLDHDSCFEQWELKKVGKNILAREN